MSMTVSFPTFERGERSGAFHAKPLISFHVRRPQSHPEALRMALDGRTSRRWVGGLWRFLPRGTWQSFSEALHGSWIGSRCAGVALLLGPDLAGDVDETEALTDTLAEPRVDTEREYPLSRSVQPFGAELPVR